MESKIFFSNLRLPAILLALLLPPLIAGCASRPVSPPPDAALEDTPRPPPAGEAALAQLAAARELTARGRRHVEKLQPDAAIRVLERALGLNPADGRNYYYLAEAWLMKTDARRAEACNRMAENLLNDDPDWLSQIARQADRIAEMKQ